MINEECEHCDKCNCGKHCKEEKPKKADALTIVGLAFVVICLCMAQLIQLF